MLNFLNSSDNHPLNASLYDAYYNTDDNCMYVYNGVRWIILSMSINYDLLLDRKNKIGKILQNIKKIK